MASSTLRSETEAETGIDVLPIDAIYEILIRLLAEELYRLRVVCQPWGSLLSDPQFIAPHATRHRRPLFVAGHGKSYRDDGILCHIIDLSGRVIKQIRSKKRRVADIHPVQRRLRCKRDPQALPVAQPSHRREISSA
ncbi:unnamed protein product [Miscanthus lutarioriparius]|uniref:F-box domain-containing protein n=1 Tax=Miscanthus lutarioriparius TaxID=422564 RepID=A0A811NRJ5_9POAL|nr:unnamed protein product [Miscanthus lutarioriparius]